ncbi:trans-resveratrol di-O-methyltransferase-like protein [Tanacetum coccineum]
MMDSLSKKYLRLKKIPEELGFDLSLPLHKLDPSPHKEKEKVMMLDLWKHTLLAYLLPGGVESVNLVIEEPEHGRAMVIYAFPWTGSFVEIGGGTGTLAKGIAKAFPSVNCINFDLAHVIDGLQGSSNLINVGGDIFKGIPKADAVLMKWILHDWNDEECIRILKRCKEAIPSKINGGKLIIIDMVVNHAEGDYKFLETQLFWDIHMMVHVKGKERSEKEWAQLFVDAGFSEYKITPVLGLRSLIEVYP